MAMKSAGRVSIRVLPDSTRFKQDLEKTLRRLERQMQVKIPVELEVARAELAKLKRQIESLVIKIRPTIDLNVSQADIDALKAQIEAMRPTVQVQLDTARAAARMATLSRTRTVEFRPQLNNAATALFLAKLRALSGLNVIGDSFRSAKEFFLNVDRNAVRFTGLISKLGAMSAIIGASVGQLVVMGAQLAAMGNIGLLAPAFFTGLGITIGVAAAAFKDMKTVLADLGPMMSKWQDDISRDFWSEAAEPIRKMANYLVPLLNTTEGSTNTAKSLGKFFGEMANSITDLLTPDKLNLMLDRMNRSIDILTTAVRPLTNSFINLGIHGSKYFERFANWVVKLSNQFDAFITRSAENGDLDRWTENAIQGFKDLGNTLRGITRIFASIDRAARTAGTVDWGRFAEGLNKAADTMNEPRFQATMVTLFEGMNAAVGGIVKGIKLLGPAIEQAAPSIKRMFETIGKIFEKMGGLLAQVISNPVLQAGIESFLDKIVVALGKLEPAMKPFADSLGGVFDLMGKVLVAVADLGAKIMIEWGPIFDKMGAKLAELIDPMNQSLKNFVEKMTPVWESFRVNIVDKLVDLIKDPLLPLIDKIVNSAAPELERAFKEVGRLLDEVVKPALKWITDELDKAITQKGEFQSIFDLPKLADPRNFGFKGGWFTTPDGWQHDRDKINKDLAPLNDSVNQALEDFWGDVGRNNEGMYNDFMSNTEGMFLDMAAGWEGMWKDFWGSLKPGGTVDQAVNKWFDDWLFKPIREGWEGMWEDIEKWYEEQKTRFQKFMGKLLGFGDPDDDGFGTSTGTVTGRGMSPGAKILPKVIDKEAENTWLDTFKQGLSERFGGLFTGLSVALELFKGTWRPSWGGFLTETETGTTNTTTNIGLTFATKLAEWGLGFETFKTNTLVSWGIWGAETLKGAETAMGGSDTTITEKTTSMATTIAAWIATNQPAWVTAFEAMKTSVVDNLGGSAESTTTNMATIAGQIVAKLEEIKLKWGPAFDTLKATLVTAWAIMTGDTTTGVNNTAAEAGQLPQKAKNSMGPLDTLVSSGRSLVEGFAAGMRERLSWVESAAIAVAAEVAKHMPHSPAKAGPLSGLGYTSYSGQALVKDFANGMMSNMAKVREATAQVAEAARLGSSADFETDLDQDGVVIDRSQVIIQTYNPVAEPTSRTTEKAANTLRMLKGK